MIFGNVLDMFIVLCDGLFVNEGFYKSAEYQINNCIWFLRCKLSYVRQACTVSECPYDLDTLTLLYDYLYLAKISDNSNIISHDATKLK